MRSRIAVLTVVVLASFLVGATTRPSHSYRLVQPWSKLTSLSDDQRGQIYQIHRRALAQKREIESQEKRDILALLSDQQKLELVELDEKQTVERKLKAAEDREPTTAAVGSLDASERN